MPKPGDVLTCYVPYKNCIGVHPAVVLLVEPDPDGGAPILTLAGGTSLVRGARSDQGARLRPVKAWDVVAGPREPRLEYGWTDGILAAAKRVTHVFEDCGLVRPTKFQFLGRNRDDSDEACGTLFRMRYDDSGFAVERGRDCPVSGTMTDAGGNLERWRRVCRVAIVAALEETGVRRFIDLLTIKAGLPELSMATLELRDLNAVMLAVIDEAERDVVWRQAKRQKQEQQASASLLSGGCRPLVAAAADRRGKKDNATVDVFVKAKRPALPETG